MSYRSDLEEVSVELVHSTDKAYLVTDGRKGPDGKRIDVWIPKSMCELERDLGKGTYTYTLTASEWLLKDRGLI